MTGKLRIRSTIEPQRPLPFWRLEKSIRGFPVLILRDQNLSDLREIDPPLLSATAFGDKSALTGTAWRGNPSASGDEQMLQLVGRSGGEINFTPSNAGVGIVFQEPPLMPWLTVEQNMALAMTSGADRMAAQQTIEHYWRSWASPRSDTPILPRSPVVCPSDSPWAGK